MRTKRDFRKCPHCKRKIVLDMDGALVGHNIKTNIKDDTLANFCPGSHALRYSHKS